MYRRLPPPPLLKDYIEYFWCGEIEIKAGEKYTHYSIASSKSQLLFHYLGDFNTGANSTMGGNIFKAGIYGQTSLFTQYCTYSTKSGIFGVQFYPHAFHALFSIPSIEITNLAIDIETVLGVDGAELADKIIVSNSFEERVKLVSDVLESRIRNQKIKYKNIEWALSEIHRLKGQVVLADLINSSCISQRQFERNFKELAGFNPIGYIKIVRFESLLDTCRYSRKSFTELALEAGYYDQAHFNHDFKRYTGFKPTEYFESIDSR